MKRQVISLVMLFFVLSVLAAGCGQTEQAQNEKESGVLRSDKEKEGQETENADIITPTSEILSLEDGLATVQYAGDYKLDEFLEQGGASSDAEVMEFLTEHLFSGKSGLEFSGGVFGCSTLSVKSADGSYIFGRNFDWNACHALIVSGKPEKGYASISTVNMDFIGALRFGEHDWGFCHD